jgi:hypothetical protein
MRNVLLMMLVCILVLCTFGCASAGNTAQDNLKKAVITVHDTMYVPTMQILGKRLDAGSINPQQEDRIQRLSQQYQTAKSAADLVIQLWGPTAESELRREMAEILDIIGQLMDIETQTGTTPAPTSKKEEAWPGSMWIRNSSLSWQILPSPPELRYRLSSLCSSVTESTRQYTSASSRTVGLSTTFTPAILSALDLSSPTRRLDSRPLQRFRLPSRSQSSQVSLRRPRFPTGRNSTSTLSLSPTTWGSSQVTASSRRRILLKESRRTGSSTSLSGSRSASTKAMDRSRSA